MTTQAKGTGQMPHFPVVLAQASKRVPVAVRSHGCCSEEGQEGPVLRSVHCLRTGRTSQVEPGKSVRLRVLWFGAKLVHSPSVYRQ